MKSVHDDLRVAEERSSSDRAAVAARQSRQDFDAWNALQLQTASDPEVRQDLHERAESVLASLDSLGELTADDGFRERQRALASIKDNQQVPTSNSLPEPWCSECLWRSRSPATWSADRCRLARGRPDRGG